MLESAHRPALTEPGEEGKRGAGERERGPPRCGRSCQESWALASRGDLGVSPQPACRPTGARGPHAGGVSAERGTGWQTPLPARDNGLAGKTAPEHFYFSLLLRSILRPLPLRCPGHGGQSHRTLPSTKREQTQGVKTCPLLPQFPFGSVLVLSTDQSLVLKKTDLAWALVRLTSGLEGRHQVARPLAALDSNTPVLPGLARCGAATPVPSNACDDGLTRLQASTTRPPPCAALSSALLLGLWGGGHILSAGPWKAALTPSMTSKLLPFRGFSSSERHYIGLGGCLS